MSALAEILPLKRDLGEIIRAVEWIDAHVQARNASEKVSSILQMVVEEVLSNVILHADPQEQSLDIELCWSDPQPGTVRIEIRDSGVAFNPLDQPDADITLNVDERDIGGLGIHLIRRYMDSCLYERRNGRNILALVRSLDA